MIITSQFRERTIYYEGKSWTVPHIENFRSDLSWYFFTISKGVQTCWQEDSLTDPTKALGFNYLSRDQTRRDYKKYKLYLWRPRTMAPILLEDLISADLETFLVELKQIASEFLYAGFDSELIRQSIKEKILKATVETVSIGGKNIVIGGGKITETATLVVAIGLFRGNKIGKIQNRSKHELSVILDRLTLMLGLKESVQDKATDITLTRAVQAFPDIAYALLKAGIGRDLAQVGASMQLCHTVSIQFVKAEGLHTWYWHFLKVAQMTDSVINGSKSSLKQLHNYLALAYNSKVIDQAKRDNLRGQTAKYGQGDILLLPAELAATIQKQLDANMLEQIA